MATESAGFAPLLFASLQKSGGGTLGVSFILAGFCALTVVSVLLLSETRDNSMSDAGAEAEDTQRVRA